MRGERVEYIQCVAPICENTKVSKRQMHTRLQSTYTGTTVLNRLVTARELGEVVARHLRLDLDRVEHLSVVDTDNRADHLWDDDHVTEVGLYDGGLLVRGGLLLGLAELLDQAEWAALETALEATAGTGVDEL